MIVIAPVVRLIVLHDRVDRSTVSPDSVVGVAMTARKLPGPLSAQVVTVQVFAAIASGAASANRAAKHAASGLRRAADNTDWIEGFMHMLPG
ncbi:hypothetical protein GCM10009105_35210 [Dokdonella soli]|uniref:Uncharacterized protein n=1 Tax=Dokdonella soli TaxID=529810 RepID=A0ABP3U6N6_9GAMM